MKVAELGRTRKLHSQSSSWKETGAAAAGWWAAAGAMKKMKHDLSGGEKKIK